MLSFEREGVKMFKIGAISSNQTYSGNGIKQAQGEVMLDSLFLVAAQSVSKTQTEGDPTTQKKPDPNAPKENPGDKELAIKYRPWMPDRMLRLQGTIKDYQKYLSDPQLNADDKDLYARETKRAITEFNACNYANLKPRSSEVIQPLLNQAKFAAAQLGVSKMPNESAKNELNALQAEYDDAIELEKSNQPEQK